ncbi:MAG: sigma-54-dependent Fis family transcriptional regulator, partial [Betaproteobacteria bacterium]|nr:sigma-54-dependent Fis family transcriptional regulator [Betaproteobacteria bacterium]
NAGPYTTEAITTLETAAWPGNVRELQHAVERAVVSNVAGPIRPADFGTLSGSGGFQAAASVDQLLPFRKARERFEREYFANLLHSTGGNVSEAARLSGIARQNFYGHIERLGIVTKS